MGCLYDWLKNGLGDEVPAGLSVAKICPSRDGHRLLVGYHGGSVRMWSIDLTGNRADTQNDTDTRQVIRISPSGKVAVTAFHSVKILDTDTGKVVARTDVEYEDGPQRTIYNYRCQASIKVIRMNDHNVL